MALKGYSTLARIRASLQIQFRVIPKIPLLMQGSYPSAEDTVSVF